MAPMRVAIRTDASARIGTGHVKRCGALALALIECGVTPSFVTRRLGLDTTSLLDERLLEHGVKVTFLASPDASTSPVPRGPVPHAGWAGVDWEADAAETITALREKAPTHVIVDHYAFDARWHRMVSASLGAQIVIIDDLADRDLDGSLLVDHNAAQDHRAKYAGRWPSDRPLLGGPRFALLDPRYAGATPATLAPSVSSIGVFMGGADADDYSRRVIAACRATGFGGQIEVVSTSANPHLAALRAACESDVATTLSVDLPNLAAFYARHGLQVGAGGGAAWERCCAGAPTLIFATADNQNLVVDELVRRGAAAATEPRQSPDLEAIGVALRRLLGDAGLRASLAGNSRRLVDGLGAVRVALSLTAESLEVRRATPRDSARILAWRNDPATRSVSIATAEISAATHESWFARVLADPSRQLYIGAVGSREVGVIRFDRREQGDHEISLFLDPALLGLKLGTHLLRAGENAVGPQAQFIARVIEENEKSRLLFAAAGYRHESPGIWRKN